MTLTRTKSHALHHYGFEKKLAELNKIYKNQPTISPRQIGTNVYRFSNNKFATKEMLPAYYVKDLNTNITSQKKIDHLKEKISSSAKHESPLTQIMQSKVYKKLYQKYTSMINKHKTKKNQLQKNLKQLNQKVYVQEEKYQELISKMVSNEAQVQELKEEYYEIRRKNLELNCELDVLRGQPQSDESSNSDNESFYDIDIDEMDYQQILLLEERMGTANVGLSSEKISKLPQKSLKYYLMQDKLDSSLNPEEDQSINCCICCQNIQQEEIVTKLSCNHIHHFQCLSKWLKMKRFCPLCKGEIKVQK